MRDNTTSLSRFCKNPRVNPSPGDFSIYISASGRARLCRAGSRYPFIHIIPPTINAGNPISTNHTTIDTTRITPR